MGLKLRLLAAVLLLVIAAGCGDKATKEGSPPETGQGPAEVETAGSESGGNSGDKQAVVSSGKDDGALKETDSGKDNATSDSAAKPNIVIKSENQVPGQEAGQMLEEVDRQLDDLLKALDGTEDIDESELLYEGGQ